MSPRASIVLSLLALLATAVPASAAPNSPPSCSPSSVSISTVHDRSKELPITCTDPDGDPVTVSIVNPGMGTITTSTDPSPKVTYIPKAHYVGNDGFSLRPNDGKVDGSPVQVSVQITNQSPTCTGPDPQSLLHGTSRTFAFSCSDPDGDPVTLSLYNSSLPAGATLDTSQLNTSAHTAAFTADRAFTGKVTLQFLPNDGTDGSVPFVNVELNVTDQPPTCAEQHINWPQDSGPVTVSVACSDPDGDPLTLSAHLIPSAVSPYASGPQSTLDTSNLNGPSHSFVWTASDPFQNHGDGITVEATDGAMHTNATIGIIVTKKVSTAQTDPANQAALIAEAAAIRKSVQNAVDALAKSTAKVHGTSINLGSVPAGTGCACNVTAVLTAKGKLVGKAKERFGNTGLKHLTVKLNKTGRKLAAKHKLKALATITVTEAGPVPAIPDVVITTTKTVAVKKLSHH